MKQVVQLKKLTKELMEKQADKLEIELVNELREFDNLNQQKELF